MKTAVFRGVNLNCFQHEFMFRLSNKTNGTGVPSCPVKKKVLSIKHLEGFNNKENTKYIIAISRVSAYTT